MSQIQQHLIQIIKQGIFQNTEEKITGQVLQDILISLVNSIYSGKQITDVTTDDRNIIITYINDTQEYLPLSSRLPENTFSQFDIGAIKKGDNISELLISDILETIVSGAPDPIIQKFYISKKGDELYSEDDSEYILQLGENLYADDEISWVYNNTKYKNNSTSLWNMKTLQSYFINKNNTSYVFSKWIPALTTIGVYPFRIQLFDIEDKEYTSIHELKFGAQFYYGSNINKELDSNKIKILNNKTIHEFPLLSELELKSKGYKYIIIPEVIDIDNWFLINTRTNFEVPIRNTQSITIINDYGISIAYNVYRTEYIIDNPIKVILKNE